MKDLEPIANKKKISKKKIAVLLGLSGVCCYTLGFFYGILMVSAGVGLFIYEKNKALKLEEKKEKMRKAFRLKFQEVDDRFEALLNTIGNEERNSFYRKEASKVFNETLKVFFSICDADARIDKLDSVRKKLFTTLDSNTARRETAVQKSKDLIARINKESNELKKYIASATEEIKATGCDFVQVAAEIELAYASGKMASLASLASRSQSLSNIASNIPSITSI